MCAKVTQEAYESAQVNKGPLREPSTTLWKALKVIFIIYNVVTTIYGESTVFFTSRVTMKGASVRVTGEKLTRLTTACFFSHLSNRSGHRCGSGCRRRDKTKR